jgi:LysM repeat protein
MVVTKPAPAPAAPAKISNAPAAPVVSTSTVTYTLKSGDSLAYVAKVKKVSIQALLDANPGLVPTRMRIGQTLVIPSATPIVSSPAPQAISGDKNTAMVTPSNTVQ